ncbi:MAG TPA: LLM class flavin-dependent oxidoreductase [Vicinamibacterales bacterium]|nr:LLM class flavin-dependent oxidoreductase [Vicinamibacterales bacterium]
MRYGYWLPVFGGWLRNVENEHMEASWDYVRRLAVRSENLGFDVALVTEQNLNDIKQPDAPVLDAWSTAAALAAITRRLELMVAVRPAFHEPALLAKQAANVDCISSGRLTLNVVSTWWADEARQYGIPFAPEDDQYARTAEWLDVVHGLWRSDRFTFSGRYYRTRNTIVEPKPASQPYPLVYGGAESDAGAALTAGRCDACILDGDAPERIALKIADLRRRRKQARRPPLTFGMAAYVILRDTEREASDELQRITDVRRTTASYRHYRQWIEATGLDRPFSLEDYAVCHGGLRAGLIGTRERVAERIADFQRAGISLLLLQCSPQLEEMDRFASAIISSDRSALPTGVVPDRVLPSQVATSREHGAAR